MTWWQRLWGRLGSGNDSAQIREAAAEQREQTEQRTPLVQHAADRLARLPAEEFAERVARAFRTRLP